MSRLRRFFVYWWENFKAAHEGKEMIAPRIALFIGLLILLCRQVGIQHLLSQTEIAKWVEWLALGYAGFVFFLWRPFQRHEEGENRISAIQEATRSRLEIEGVESEVTESQQTYRIKITNRGTKTADEVRAELIEPPGGQSLWWGITFPKRLTPSIGRACSLQRIQGNLVKVLSPDTPPSQSLNPGESAEFNLLTAARDKAPVCVGGYSVVVQMSTPGDPLSTVFREHRMEDSYRLKLRATARDFPESADEFDLVFSGGRSICRFTLQKIHPCNSKTPKKKTN